MGKCIIPRVSLYLKEQGLFQVVFSIFVRDLTKEIIFGMFFTISVQVQLGFFPLVFLSLFRITRC